MASVLRYYLDNSSEVISLSEELKQIECYLDILRQQYVNQIRVSCVLSEGSGEAEDSDYWNFPICRTTG